MTKVYTLGKKLPQKIADVITDWNYWLFITCGTTEADNKDAEFVMKNLKVARYREFKANNGLSIFVGYTL